MHASKFMNRWGCSRRLAALSFGGAISLAFGGCDPQASPDFQGLSLLTVHGSVTIAEDHTHGELEPALSFVNQETGEIEILDVGVQGEFPSNFQLNVFAPPSADAIRRWTDLGEHEPRLALGYITAVTPDHPKSFYYATDQSSEVRPNECDGCELECDPVRGCATTEEWCSDQGTQCYRETTICPAPDSPPEACRIETEGDPALKEPAFRFFSGFSQNYAIAYLADPAPDGSGTAALLGAKHSLSAGYHLLRVRDVSAAELAESDACAVRADRLGLDHYNEHHATHLAPEDATPEACIGSVCLPDSPNCQPSAAPTSPVCSLSGDEMDAFYDALRIEGVRARVELGCPLSPFTAVANPDEAAISIEIGLDAQPGF